MSSYPQSTPNDRFNSQQSPPAGGGCGCGGCALGCAIGAVLLALVCGGVIWYVAANFKSTAVFMAREGIKMAVQDLPEADQQAIINETNRMLDAYERGDIELSEADAKRLIEAFQDSPLIVVIVVNGLDQQYITPSGLSDEEKADARMQISRVARGVLEGAIPQEKVNAITERYMEQHGAERRMKERLTDDELRQLTEEFRALANEAEVPEEEYEVNIPAEVKKVVDKFLEGKEEAKPLEGAPEK